MGHEEGRIRKAADGVTFVFDYFLKDHLGNVRMMLTEESKTDVYPTLDFEGTGGTTAVTNQDAVWDNSTGGAVDVVGTRTAFNMGNGTTNGTYSKLIKKQSAGGAIGAAKLLKVMSGDQINTSVDYYYTNTSADNHTANGLSTLATSLLSAITGSSAVTAGAKAGASTATTIINTSGSTADAFLSGERSNTTANQPPEAYLHVLLFNEQFVFDNANSYIQKVSTANALTTIRLSIPVKKNGYAYVYFSNESESPVWFDNFTLNDVRGQILQESHYYPFGLTMAGISSQAMAFGGFQNKREFNGGNELQNKEFSDGSGLEMYDARNRMYDPQLGRFAQIDALADFKQINSPYVFASDNPISMNDPLGLQDSVPMLQNVTVTTTQKPNSNNEKQSQILPLPYQPMPLTPIPLFPVNSNYKDPEADPLTGVNWLKVIPAAGKDISQNALRLFAAALLKIYQMLHAGKTVDDLINDGTVEGTTGNGTVIVTRQGGMTQADKDFDDLAEPGTVKPNPNPVQSGGRIGKTSDGKTINVRPTSSGRDPKPTLEIFNPNTRKEEVKFRYDK